MVVFLVEKGVDLECILGYFQFNRDVDDEEVRKIYIYLFDVVKQCFCLFVLKVCFFFFWQVWIKEKEFMLLLINYGNNLFEV